MLIIRCWRYCRGYLIVLLKGCGVERLLNLALVRGISFWDLKKKPDGTLISLPLRSFKALRPLVKKTRCQLSIRRKAGLPFWIYRLRRRWGLPAGLALFILSLYLATSLVWTIQVAGNHELEEEEVLKLAEELGIKPWVWKRSLSLPELEEELARRNGQIAWSGIRIRGTLLEIEIVEHIPEPEMEKGPADIVAARDGVIKRILALEGEAVVAPGDTVAKGDLLIRGTMIAREPPLPSGEEPPVLEVRARGEVEARVWYEAVVPVNLTKIIPEETGRTGQDFILRWSGGRKKIWGPGTSPFEISRQEITRWRWQWRNLSLPVEILTIKYYEIVEELLEFSPAEAMEQARKEALGQVREQLSEDESPGQINIREFEDRGKRWVRAVAETKEDIGEIRPRQ